MRHGFHNTALLLLSFAALLEAQVPLPDNGFYPGWKRSGRTRIFQASALFNHIDGGAELFLEFGFESLCVQRYAKDRAELALEMYRMTSPEAALGVYLLKCGRETPLKEIPARNTHNRYQTTVWKGCTFIQVNNPGGDSLQTEVAALLGAVLPSIEAAGEIPLFSLLTLENLIPGTERLIRGPSGLEPIFTFGPGDILELEGSVFAVLADYRENGKVVTRIWIPYPSAEKAGRVFGALLKGLDPALKALVKDDSHLLFSDYNNLYGLITLQDRLIRIALHLETRPVW